MRFTATVADLQAAVNAVLPAVPGRPTLQALSHILIITANNRATLRGTDLSVGVERALAVRDMEPGEALIPAKLTAEILSALASTDDVTIETVVNSGVRLRTSRNTSRLAALDPQDYPEFPSGDTPLATLKGAQLLTLINGVAYAAAAEDSRPVLTGINIVAGNGTITASAADGFRLALRRIAADTQPFEMLLNAGAVRPLRQLCKPDDDVQVFTGTLQRHLILRSADWTLTCSIIDGKYPDVGRIIPGATPHVAVVSDHRDLLRAVALNALTAENSLVRVALDDKAINIISNYEGNNTASIVEAGVSGGTTQNVGLNSKYLRDAVQAVAGPVALRIISPQSPTVVVRADDAQRALRDVDDLHIVMPMSIR